MAIWVALFVLAVTGTTVFADSRFAFIEDVKADSRIVSGWEAEDGQFPYQLSLRMVNPAGGVNGCGGTIIHAQWGLTAAHCTAGRVTVVIRAGTVNLTLPTAIFETTKYFNHPLYNEALQTIVQPNDIGLLEFGRTLEFGPTIQPIRIQRSSAMNENYGGRRSIASGWGRTWTLGSSPEKLNWVYLRLNSNLDCRTAFGGSSIIQDSTICASFYNVTSQSTCQGDSGGPLLTIDDDGEITQVGISSFVSSTGCHTPFPAGFIRPGHYHRWFTELTGIDFDWEYNPSEEETPDSPDTEEEPDSPETDETPDSPESDETPDSPESDETPDSPESDETPDSPESEEKPDSPQSE